MANTLLTFRPGEIINLYPQTYSPPPVRPALHDGAWFIEQGKRDADRATFKAMVLVFSILALVALL